MIVRAALGSGVPLTDRELEAVELAADGLTVNAIANRLGVKAGAVQSRLKFARSKTGSVRTTALVHNAYASKQLARPSAEDPEELSEDELRVLCYLAEGLTFVEMKARVSWPGHRLRDAYNDLLVALGATYRPAYAIKRGWAMGHLGQEEQTS